MVSKVTAAIVAILLIVVGTGAVIAYRDGVFSKNSTSSQSSASGINNTLYSGNIAVSQVQTYFTITDSQGVNYNFTEFYSGFKMIAGNATFFTINVVNNNFFNITLNRFEIQSDGFDLENISPSLPISISSHNSKNLTLQVFAQSTMKYYNGSIQLDVFGNRSTNVSIPAISVSETINNDINNTKSIYSANVTGFKAISGEVVQYNLTIYNNNTYGINVTQISVGTVGFTIESISPHLPIIIMPSNNRTFTLNISVSQSLAGYHSGLLLKTNSTSTLKVEITSIKPYLESISFYGTPSIFGTIGSNAVAGNNFTIQINLMEFYGQNAEIWGFKSSTTGFTVISAHPFGGTLPTCMSNEGIWFIINIHVSTKMAGYSGSLSIGINDSAC